MESVHTIKVTLKLFTKLTKSGERFQVLNLPEGTRLADVLAKQAPMDEPLIVVVNGVPEHHRDRILENEDVVALFPTMGGG